MINRRQEIRNFIVQTFLYGQEDGLTDETPMLDHGIIDSTGVLELVMHLETTYGIKVQDHELLPENLDSISAVAAYLEKKLQPAPPAA